MIADILIIVDMQNDFIDGSLGSPEAQAIVPRVIEKAKEYKESGREIFATYDTHYSSYLMTHEGKYLPVEHCISGSTGWMMQMDLFKAISGATALEKNGFGFTDWYDAIPSHKSIEIVGLCTDICVVSNALMLRSEFPEADIVVDASCCAGTTPERHRAALEVMKSCHIDIINEDNSDERSE